MGSLGDQVTVAMFGLHELVFGDVMTAVDMNGNATQFRCLMEDFVRVSADQIAIDQSGIRDIEVRTYLVHNDHLKEVGINRIEPTMYFLDADGIRWDLSDEDMIARAIVPIDGSQCMTQFRLRKSSEISQTEAETEFTWE